MYVKQCRDFIKMNPLENPQLKNLPYTVPQGYFEALPGLMRQQVEDNAQPAMQRSSLKFSFSRSVLRNQLALAASLVLLFGLAYGGLYLASPRQITDSEFFASEEGFTPFRSYTLWEDLQDDDDAYDPEEVITFLTDSGISPLAIASLD